MNKLEWLIAWRYLGAQRKSLFVSLIGIFSMLGVSIGVFALIVALSAVNGFEEEVTAQMIGKDAHFEMYAYRGDPVENYEELARKVVENDSEVVASAPFIIYKVGISSKKVNDGVVLYGIDTERSAKVVNLSEKIVSGAYSLDSLPDAMGERRAAAILGVSLANRLRVLVGDKIVIQTFQSSDMSSGGPKILSCVVSGIFETGMYEYDGNIVYIGIPEAQKLLGMGDAVSGIQFRVKDQWKADASVERAGEAVGYPYYFIDWKTKNITLLKWMNYEKFIVAAIICLIILVAAFNIISSLIMVVTDKTREIGILRSMGLSKFGVMRVFMLMGSFIGIGGTVLGGTTGLALCALQQHYHFITLPGDVYVLPYFPVLIDPVDVVVVFLVGILLCTLSTLLPAWKASKLDPVGAIHHE